MDTPPQLTSERYLEGISARLRQRGRPLVPRSCRHLDLTEQHMDTLGADEALRTMISSSLNGPNTKGPVLGTASTQTNKGLRLHLDGLGARHETAAAVSCHWPIAADPRVEVGMMMSQSQHAN